MNNQQTKDQQQTKNQQKAPLPKNELQRVLELTELDLDYTALQDSLNDLSKLAAHVAGTEVSLVNLIDTYTQWSVSNYGFEDVKDIPREDSVCQYTILQEEYLEVEGLKEDDRFSKAHTATADTELAYYFGIPLTTKKGQNIGALCVLDLKTKDLTPEKVELLKIIANEIVTRLESIHKINELNQTLDDISGLPRKLLHDIRGPVGGIIGLAEIIKSEAQERNLDDIIELIELIDKGGKSVLELADEILSSHSKQEAEELQDSDKYEFNLLLLQEKLQQLFEPQATSKGVNLAVKTSGDNQKLPFPKHKLLQITGNLVSNAVKFTPKDGDVIVDLNLEENTGETLIASHRLHITVQDTGTGFDPEQIADIQNEDSEIENISINGTNGEKGYGFGIRLVKHLVHTLEGKIQLESEKGKGTKIEVSIPIDL